MNNSLPSETQLIEYAKTCPYYNRIPEFYVEEDKYTFYGKEAYTKFAYYWAYANYFKPETILEIGVRHGYSLLSMALGHSDHIPIFTTKEGETNHIYKTPYMLGIDSAKEATFENVQKWESEYGLYGLHLYEGDSKNITKFEAAFELIHIDGDHTPEGCLNDLKLCWPALEKGGVLIVDDYISISTVKETVDNFLVTVESEISQKLSYNCIYGGHILIQKKMS